MLTLDSPPVFNTQADVVAFYGGGRRAEFIAETFVNELLGDSSDGPVWASRGLGASMLLSFAYPNASDEPKSKVIRISGELRKLFPPSVREIVEPELGWRFEFVD